VKISDLSRRTGVPISRIKYYIREGLLPPGDATAPNQADYGERHLSGIELIRSLREHADLSIPAIRRVVAGVAAAEEERRDGVAEGFRSVGSERRAAAPAPVLDREQPEYRRARAEFEEVFRARAWTFAEDDPDVQELLTAVITARRVLTDTPPAGGWQRYADLAETAASFEVPDDWDPDRHPRETLRFAIAGTYLLEPIILAFRRIALSERHHRLRARRQRERGAGEEPARGRPPRVSLGDEAGGGD
jgi:DNA-binding transcriptional MerR regulator